MKKNIFWLVVIGLLLFTSLGYCANYNVQSNTSQNNQGYIFISTGQKQGGTEIGTWTDPTTIPTLKGDKGDPGKDGVNGYTPIKNVDYFDGIDGIDGISIKGDTGENGKDVDPATVIDLQSEDIVLQDNINTETTQRINGDTKLQSNINSVNSRVDDVSNRVSALERTQYIVKTELKFIREKHLEVGIYGEYNVGRSLCSEIGLNIVIPIGEGYQDRENKKINARLNRLEQYMVLPEVQEGITQTKMKNIKVNTDGQRFWIEKEF